MCGELCCGSGEPKSLTQAIIKMVEETPNDQDLGKKVRNLIEDIYGVQAMRPKTLGEARVKEIVDGIYGTYGA
jgi:hypothetical protein